MYYKWANIDEIETTRHFSAGSSRVGRQARVGIYRERFRVRDTIFKNKNK